MRGLGAEIALRQIHDQDLARVHRVGDVDRRSVLAKHGSDEWVCEQDADLVLNRRERLDALATIKCFEFALPIEADHGIDAILGEPAAKLFVDEEAGKPDQTLILVVEQQAQRVGENVFEARSPAVPPDVLECRDDVRRACRAVGFRDARKRIVGEGVGRVGGVEIDDLGSLLAWRRGGDRLAGVAVGIKKAEARAGLHVGAHEVE